MTALHLPPSPDPSLGVEEVVRLRSDLRVA